MLGRVGSQRKTGRDTSLWTLWGLPHTKTKGSLRQSTQTEKAGGLGIRGTWCSETFINLPNIVLLSYLLPHSPGVFAMKGGLCLKMVLLALFTIAKLCKQPKCPTTDELIKKMWCIYTMEYYSVIKKEWKFAICSNMDGHGRHSAKWNKSDRERKILYAITYIRNLKKLN